MSVIPVHLWRDSFRRLETLWQVDLGDAQVEWSRRLTRSLGLCYPRRGLIRVSTRLDAPDHRQALLDTLVHEAAHLAAWRLGHRGRPHGEPWRRLMRLAGADERACSSDPKLATAPGPPRVRLECSDCGASFYRRRSDRRWRCRSCLARGLAGFLKVTRLQG